MTILVIDTTKLTTGLGYVDHSDSLIWRNLLFFLSLQALRIIRSLISILAALRSV